MLICAYMRRVQHVCNIQIKISEFLKNVSMASLLVHR